MSVEERKVVDFVGIGKADGRAILTISDHLAWLPDNEHLRILQDKINDHLAFIESGEIYERYPQARVREIEIQVMCKYAPIGDGARFLDLAGETVRGAGFHSSAKTAEHSNDQQS